MLVRIAALVAFGFALPAFSFDRVGGSLAVTSDYVYRGVTQTRGEPAAQADLHYAAQQGWTVGVWASTVELNWWDGRTAEVDAYFNYRWSFNRDWTASIAATHYAYPWNDNRFKYDYDEIAGSIGYRNMLFFTVAWSPDSSRYSTSRGYVKNEDAFAYEAALALPLRHGFSANLGVGYYDLKYLIDAGYTYWNVGLSYELNSWRADVSYIDTSANAEDLLPRDSAGNRVAVTLSWRF